MNGTIWKVKGCMLTVSGVRWATTTLTFMSGLKASSYESCDLVKHFSADSILKEVSPCFLLPLLKRHLRTWLDLLMWAEHEDFGEGFLLTDLIGNKPSITAKHRYLYPAASGPERSSTEQRHRQDDTTAEPPTCSRDKAEEAAADVMMKQGVCVSLLSAADFAYWPISWAVCLRTGHSDWKTYWHSEEQAHSKKSDISTCWKICICTCRWVSLWSQIACIWSGWNKFAQQDFIASADVLKLRDEAMDPVL